MSRNEYDANQALAANTWQNRQGRPEEWERRPKHGTGVVTAVYWVISASLAFVVSAHVLARFF